MQIGEVVDGPSDAVDKRTLNGVTYDYGKHDVKSIVAQRVSLGSLSSNVWPDISMVSQ